MGEEKQKVAIYCEKCGFLRYDTKEHYREDVAKLVMGYCYKCCPNTSSTPPQVGYDDKGEKVPVVK